MIIRAPLIYPVDAPPLENGAVLVRNDRIAAVGPFSEIEKQAPSGVSRLDLPNSILLPGFVNAHSHLELTSLQGLSCPGHFSDWIRKVVEAKPNKTEEDYEKGIQEGIRRMIASGITTVGDHVSFNTDLDSILTSPLRGILFVEVLGVVKEVAEDILSAAEEFERIYQGSPRFQIVASPHSAHAVHPEVLPKLFSPSRRVLSIHLAESEDENRYFQEKEGPLYELIAERNEGALITPLQKSSLQYLTSQSLLSPQIMAVHCNYLDPIDIDLISHHHMSVVHCPSSHAYFRHKKFPLEALRERKINIALGTDSLASGPTLSMLDELRLAQKNYPEISPEEWIFMTTLGGATALKMENEIGSITPGKKADLMAIEIDSFSKKEPSRALEKIFHAQRAQFVMIDGRVIL